MNEFFKPDDFWSAIQYTTFDEDCKKKCADAANKKLNAEIEKWPVVWLDAETCTRWSEYIKKESAKRARLAFIEEIPKEPEICKCCGKEIKK